MNLSTLVRRVLLSTLLMSLAWSLRGQFGHLKGALIPGALSAASVAFCHPRFRNRKAIAWALLLGPLGFCVGGHLSYGKTILAVLSAAGLSTVLAELFRIFLLGGVWGGLGMTFLGFAFSEEALEKKDLFFLGGITFSWVLFLGIFNLESYDLALLLGSLVLIHIYNVLFKKSASIAFLGTSGTLGFGFGFLVSVLLLYAGKIGMLGGGWPWWALRDQIIGILGGLSLFAAAFFISWKPSLSWKEDLNGPLTIERWGLVSYLVLVPFPNAVNLLTYWALERSMFSKSWLVLGVGVLAAVACIKIFWLAHLKLSFPTLIYSTLFLIWFLSFLGIVKETVPLGIKRWESAYTLFLVYSFILTILLLQEKKYG